MLSLLFNPVVGGAMMARNLKDMQQPGAARMALGGSTLYTGLTLYLLSHFAPAPLFPWLSWASSLATGLGLEAYGKRFIADWQSQPVKSNVKPFIICLSVLGLLFGLVFSAAKPGI
ncbi:hypothetical protein ACFST9_18710 [Hymenobacter monticola]|uniref:hypothetical protein n=1 Tax=Hymenobacter monticola TaxID=1705399 RepID=UPI0036331636